MKLITTKNIYLNG